MYRQFQAYSRITQYLRRGLRRSVAECGALYRRRTARLHPAPILILGHAKSGTTAITALLAEISGQSATIDPIYRIDPEGYLQRRMLSGELSLESLVRSNKFYFSTPIIKDPKLTFFARELGSCFPRAKFIFVIRDPRDNIRSFLNRRGIPGNLERIPPDKNAWIGNLPPVAGEHYIEKLANRWNLAAEVYLSDPSRFTLIRYEDFTADKVGVIEDLARQMQLATTADISGSIDVQYQPRGNYSRVWTEFFGDNLGLIETICGERMDRFGYAPSVSNVTEPERQAH